MRAGRQATDNIDDGNWTAPMSRDRADFKGFTWTNYADTLVSAWNLDVQDHRHKFAISCPADPHYLRRLAGHVKTGRASRSDPAIASAVI